MRIASLDRAEARGEARGENRFASLIKSLLEDGRTDDVKIASENEEARKLFYREYGMID